MGGTPVQTSKAHNTTYTSVDLNATGTTTLYTGTQEAMVAAFLGTESGTTVEVSLEATDGTNTTRLADNEGSAGTSIAVSDTIPITSSESLQANVHTAEGSDLTGTAVVFAEELDP